MEVYICIVDNKRTKFIKYYECGVKHDNSNP